MDPTTIELIKQCLIGLGSSLSANFVYEKIKLFLLANDKPSYEELKNEINSILSISKQNVYSEKIIQILAKEGLIDIRGTSIYAKKAIIMSSDKQGSFSFGDNSISETEKSKISAGKEAYISGRGKTRIEQDEEGNINFFVG